jgi:hypothetical protein
MLLPFPFISTSETVQEDFARNLLDLGSKIQEQPIALLLLPGFHSGMLPRITRLLSNPSDTVEKLIKEADQRTNGKEKLLGHRLALEIIEKSYYTLSRTDQEKVTALIGEVERHVDENVRAIALSYGRTVIRA